MILLEFGPAVENVSPTATHCWRNVLQVVFLFNIKTFKLIANFNKIWHIMFYAVFAAWSTRSYQDAGTADTGLTRSICMGFHNCYLDLS